MRRVAVVVAGILLALVILGVVSVILGYLK
jgi:hypothetical protein